MTDHLGLSLEPKDSRGHTESTETLMPSPFWTGRPAGLLIMSISPSLCRMLSLTCCITASSSISVCESAWNGLYLVMDIYPCVEHVSVPVHTVAPQMHTIAPSSTLFCKAGMESLRSISWHLVLSTSPPLCRRFPLMCCITATSSISVCQSACEHRTSINGTSRSSKYLCFCTRTLLSFCGR